MAHVHTNLFVTYELFLFLNHYFLLLHYYSFFKSRKVYSFFIVLKQTMWYFILFLGVPDWDDENAIVSNLICMAIVGIEDPVRPEVLLLLSQEFSCLKITFK